jgi:hypothetical protein
MLKRKIRMSQMKSLLAVSAAGVCLSLASSAQSEEHGLVWTNLGELRVPTTGQHVLTGKALAIHGLEGVRAELAPFAYHESVSSPASSGPEMTNTG